MLSELLSSGCAFLDHSRKTFTVSHRKISLPQLAPLLPPLVSLKLNHCQLTSLQGIEHFPHLEQLSLRHNSLEQPGELLRIRGRESLSCLDFRGNDIEYLGSCLFIRLVKHFPRLVELNGRNYGEVVRGRGRGKGKGESLRGVLERARKLEGEFRRTVRQQRGSHRQREGERQREGDRHKDKDRERIITITSVKTQPQPHTRNYEPSYHDQSSPQSPQQSLSPESSYGQPCTTKKPRLSPHTNSRRQLEDISLGAISNIPLTKSIRNSCVGEKGEKGERGRGRGLEIFTLNESLQNNRVQLAQPTATFAMQREKENADPAGFGFRNRGRTMKYRMGAAIEEGGEGWKEEERPTKRETYGSVEEGEEQDQEVSLESSFSHGLMRQSKMLIKKSENACLVGLHNNFLLGSYFRMWKGRREQRNLPFRRLH